MNVPDNTRDTTSRMERDWDSRAREAAEYYIATGRREWGKEEFFAGGAINVDNDILPDAVLIGQGRKLKRMRMLEIGCGAGRMTRAMAALFGEVHAVDISAEMIALAKKNLSDLRNVFLYKTSGSDLAGLRDQSCDFAFSYIVFQHIPDRGVIENYVREVHRILKPGSFFKFQVQGDTGIQAARDDTWVGAPMSLADAQALAERCGFEWFGSSGEGTQYFWLWFRKPALPAVRMLHRLRDAIEAARLRCTRPAAVTFTPESVRAGEMYRVRIPRFAGQVIDVGYELKTATGVVGNWCELDARGEAQLPAPADHPAGVVRITKVRSRTKNGRWVRAHGALEVTPADV